MEASARCSSSRRLGESDVRAGVAHLEVAAELVGNQPFETEQGDYLLSAEVEERDLLHATESAPCGVAVEDDVRGIARRGHGEIEPQSTEPPRRGDIPQRHLRWRCRHRHGVVVVLCAGLIHPNGERIRPRRSFILLVCRCTIAPSGRCLHRSCHSTPPTALSGFGALLALVQGDPPQWTV